VPTNVGGCRANRPSSQSAVFSRFPSRSCAPSFYKMRRISLSSQALSCLIRDLSKAINTSDHRNPNRSLLRFMDLLVSPRNPKDELIGCPNPPGDYVLSITNTPSPPFAFLPVATTYRWPTPVIPPSPIRPANQRLSSLVSFFQNAPSYRPGKLSGGHPNICVSPDDLKEASKMFHQTLFLQSVRSRLCEKSTLKDQYTQPPLPRQSFDFFPIVISRGPARGASPNRRLCIKPEDTGPAAVPTLFDQNPSRVEFCSSEAVADTLLRITLDQFFPDDAPRNLLLPVVPSHFASSPQYY